MASGMLFGPGTSEPMADEGLLLGLLQTVSTLSGQVMAKKAHRKAQQKIQ